MPRSLLEICRSLASSSLHEDRQGRYLPNHGYLDMKRYPPTPRPLEAGSADDLPGRINDASVAA
jgi:hypothetical protein